MTNVVQALAAVMSELPAIGKTGQASASQGGYAYRGIEAITKHAQGLFAKHGVVFVPKVLEHEVVDIVVGGKPWTDTRLLVAYDVFGPGGAEDRIMVGPLLGIGRDNADKGANKAMTQAFKYALLQVLCISDAKDDADGSTHEADERADYSGRTTEDHQRAREVERRYHALPEEAQDVLDGWLAKHGLDRDQEFYNPAFERLIARAEAKAEAERPFAEAPDAG